jgi:hypothetical protein
VKTKKLRRHSGRVTPRFSDKGKYSELIKEGLEPQEQWDDWEDYRDGFRVNKDKKQLRRFPKNSFMARYFDIERWNKKLKKLIKRRNAKKIRTLF